MKTPRLCLAVFVSMLAASAAFGGKNSVVTAVSSRVGNGYHRQKMPDGSFKREYYALTKGIYMPGIGRDPSIDGVRYPQIAKICAQFLALQNYYLAADSKSADLLLAISWGKTVPFSDSVYQTNMNTFFSARNTLAVADKAPHLHERSVEGIQSPEASVRDAAREDFAAQLFQLVMFDDARRSASEGNARVLGYVDEINRRDTPARFAGAGDAYQDLVNDIENERYYVVLTAYDFRSAAKGEKLKPLWTTRVSIEAQGNRFNETLAAMLTRASRYFGQDSGRLVRQYEPNAKVTFGELRQVGYEPNSEPDDKPAGTKEH